MRTAVAIARIGFDVLDIHNITQPKQRYYNSKTNNKYTNTLHKFSDAYSVRMVFFFLLTLSSTTMSRMASAERECR